MDQYFNVFVCHVWGHHDAYYDSLLKLLRSDLFLRDLSVPEYRSIAGPDRKVWRQIRGSIENCDVVLVINTPAISHSAYACRELAFAKRMEKPIVALAPHGHTGRERGSSIVREYMQLECSWSRASIVDAIEQVA